MLSCWARLHLEKLAATPFSPSPFVVGIARGDRLSLLLTLNARPLGSADQFLAVALASQSRQSKARGEAARQGNTVQPRNAAMPALRPPTHTPSGHVLDLLA